MPQKITQIPFPGGSGATPTGAMQFQDDWPGLFLRGDAAISLHSNIIALEQKLAGHPDPLIGVILLQMRHIAEVIERDVIVR